VAGAWTVGLTVTDTTLSLSTTIDTKTIHVAMAPALQIAGPQSAAEGQLVQFTSTGAGASSAMWSVALNGTPITDLTGSGSQFDFTPVDSGSYVITATSSSPVSSVSYNLAVAYVPPTVMISGPAVSFAGKSPVFGSQFSTPPAAGDTLSYQWQVLNADGSAASSPVTGGPTFVAPGTLTPNSYQLQLTITDQHGGVAVPISANFSFVVLSLTVSTSSQFDWGAIPTTSEYSDRSPITDAIVQQADGKLVVAGDATILTNGDHYAFLARFNADLTLDTSFGADHTGIVIVDMDEAVAPGQIFKGSRIFALAINPVNQDIVAVGDAAKPDEPPMLAVAEFVAADTVTPQGQLVLAGTLDPAFNNGHPQTLAGPNTVSAGWAVSVLPDGSMLVGGMEWTMGTDAATETVKQIEGIDWDITVAVDDFLLVKLTPDGQLDTSFNGTGIAQEPDLTGLPAYTPFAAAVGEPSLPTGWDGYWGMGFSTPSNIQTLVILPNGQILAGGYAHRFALDGDGNLLGEGVDTGFALVRYNADGTIDTSFGTDGQTFTSSDVFNQTPDGTAYLSAMEVLPNGKILTAGLADSTDAINANSFGAHVVLAQYDADGQLDTNYGSGGIIKADLIDQLSGASTFDNDGETHNLDWRPEDGAFAFQQPDASLPDGRLVMSMIVLNQITTTTSFWQMAALDPTTGALDSSFGIGGTGQFDVPVPAPPSGENWYFATANRSSAILLTGDSVVGVGDLFNVQPNIYETMVLPLVVRYRQTPSPIASNLAAAVTLAGDIALTWTNTGFGQDGFEIRRATSEEGLDASAQIASVGPTQTDYVDTTTAPGTTYYYCVVPFSTDSSGTIQLEAGTDPVKVQSFSGNVSSVLQQTLSVPLDGSPVTSTSALQTGETYLLVASGAFQWDTVDPASSDPAYYWYSDSPVINITSLVCSDGTATATPTYEDNYKLGDKVLISGADQAGYNGLATITALDAYSFSFAVPSGTPALATGQLLTVQKFQPTTSGNTFTQRATPVSLTSLSCSGNTVTALTNTAHGYSTGDKVYVSGVDQDQYDGLFTITALSDTSFSYTVASGTPSVGTGSVCTAQKINQVQYGIGLDDTGTTELNQVPNWGSADDANHTYTLAYIGQGTPLTFQLHDANSHYPTNTSTTGGLQIQIYAVGMTGSSSVSSTPIMRITSPAVPLGGTSPVISSNTPLDIISANPDGSQTPWALWLISSTGNRVLLANSTQSVGQLPASAAQVATLNPALYPNGVYTLQLTSTLSDPQTHIVDSRQVVLATAVKAGNFALPMADEWGTLGRRTTTVCKISSNSAKSVRLTSSVTES